jgi:hypothetical protein
MKEKKFDLIKEMKKQLLSKIREGRLKFNLTSVKEIGFVEDWVIIHVGKDYFIAMLPDGEWRSLKRNDPFPKEWVKNPLKPKIEAEEIKNITLET